MEEEIKAEFTKNSFSFDDEEEILQKCLTFCIQYKLSASDLVSSWDLYAINRSLDSTVRSSHMGAFLEHLQSEQLNKVREKESGLHLYSNDVAMILNGNYEEVEGILHTPPDKRTLAHEKPSDSAQKTNGSRFISGKPLESVTPFGSRKNKFVVQTTLNEHSSMQTIKTEEDHNNSEDDIIKRLQPSQKCSLLIDRSKPEPGCRFMYDRVEDKFNFLEDCIKKRATAYVSSKHYEEPVDPSVASQVVGVEGHNPSGHCLIASKIIDYVPLSVTSSEQHPSKRQAMDHSLQLTNPSHDTSEVSLIQDYVEYMGSAVRVILMPSIRDANHDFVFPQPAFDIHPADFNHQIYSISNPGVFHANEVTDNLHNHSSSSFGAM
ncbi:UNVERIFIED_CONTAM: hypothetical protein Sangu_0526200 [Sesamum angustifolium]|uniref:DNA polymerase alpha subunit B n=1 Tax=Sesamum angustifolium TaxID=2727405 RepID=A0AAW2Q998_9LAMI